MITKEEIKSFCNGMVEMYDYAKSINPEVLLFPLRGAFPFFKSYTELVRIKKEKMPRSILLPLGSLRDVQQKNKLRGLKKREKVQIISDYLLPHFLDSPRPKKFLLIDEVGGGGTIIEHHRMISKTLEILSPESSLDVCTIECGRVRQRNKYVNKAKKFGYHRIGVSSLYTMDRKAMLPELQYDSGFVYEVDEACLQETLGQLEETANE